MPWLGVREAVAIVAGTESVHRRAVHRGLGRALRRRRMMRVAVPGACDVGGIASVGGRTWPSVWLKGERRRERGALPLTSRKYKRRLRVDSGVRAPDTGTCGGVGIKRKRSRQRESVNAAYSPSTRRPQRSLVAGRHDPRPTMFGLGDGEGASD